LAWSSIRRLFLFLSNLMEEKGHADIQIKNHRSENRHQDFSRTLNESNKYLTCTSYWANLRKGIWQVKYLYVRNKGSHLCCIAYKRWGKSVVVKRTFPKKKKKKDLEIQRRKYILTVQLSSNIMANHRGKEQQRELICFVNSYAP
jgi:hypothetical protein